MAPTVASIHKLVFKNARLAKAVWRNVSNQIFKRAPDAQLQPALARSTPRHPIHPSAYLRQSKGRWYTTHNYIVSSLRGFATSAGQAAGPKFSKASFPQSRVRTAVGRLSGRSPFASTLRPNLTGGTLGRSAGGYGYGGGSARFFSHGPAAPTQVINSVSQAMRAFLISGNKAQFDGMSPRGDMRFKTVTTLQDEATRKMNSVPRTSPGSYIDFSINPTITALAPIPAATGFTSTRAPKETLGSDGLMDAISVDFSRSLRELAAVLECLKRLCTLGDLPITYQPQNLRVHFPGCDASTVERLCDELGIFRGIIHEDEDFDSFVGTEIALMFPFAPSKVPSERSYYTKPVTGRKHHMPAELSPDHIEWQNMLSPSEGQTVTDLSTHSNDGFEFETVENPWRSGASPPLSGYESVHTSDGVDNGFSPMSGSDMHTPLEYQGIEGIYRFMEQCGSGASSRWE